MAQAGLSNTAAESLREQVLSAAGGAAAGRLRGAALPLPGAEAWKYSPVNRLYEALQTDATSTTPQVTLPEGLASQLEVEPKSVAGAIDWQRYPLASLTAALVEGWTCIDIGASQAAPIRLDHRGTGNSATLLRVAPNTRTQLVERYAGDQQGSSLLVIELGRGAQLEHALTLAASAGVQWRLTVVRQAADSHYRANLALLGGTLQRLDTHVVQEQRGASSQIEGALLACERNRTDHQAVLEHRAAHGRSVQRYHGLAGNGGRLTLGGRIHIHADGQAVDAGLSNPNLLLDDSGEVNSKPELEIYQDDVRCAHGATVGQLDRDALFYLRSRGIDAHAARALLLRAFIDDVLSGPDAEHARSLAQAAAAVPLEATP